jgi:long-chain fatty acid transport protein
VTPRKKLPEIIVNCYKQDSYAAPLAVRGDNMNKLTLASSALAMFAGLNMASAGGIDRSGQDISIIYEKGKVMQLSFGLVSPNVSGLFMGAVSSGDMAATYLQMGFGYKQDFSDKLSFAVVVDQPFGAAVDYSNAAAVYPFVNSTATVSALAVTGIARYSVSDRISVHGGLRLQTLSGEASLPRFGYTLDASSNLGVGYLVGASYEIPDIALRAAITYNSEIEHTMSGSETFPITTPESINIDLQTGIAANTLLFASARWVDWSDFVIDPPAFPARPLVSYDNDSISYSLGVGRKFNDQWSGSISVGYEETKGGPVSNLGPTDGYLSLQVGAQYTKDNMKISGGIRYIDIGDATTSTIGAAFKGNSGIGIGVKVSYTF